MPDITTDLLNTIEVLSGAQVSDPALLALLQLIVDSLLEIDRSLVDISGSIIDHD